MKKVLVPLGLAVLVAVGCNTQSSTNKGKGGEELTLKTPQSVTVNQEGTAEFAVKIERKKFDEPVTVKFEKLPEGVTVEESDHKLDKGVKERTFHLKASDKAKVGSNKILVVASSKDMTDRHEVNVEVKEKGSHTTLSSPLSGQNKDDLKQKREELTAAVQAKMKEIDASMAQLRAEAKKATGDAQVALNKRIDELHAKRQDLSRDYDRIQSTTKDAWQEFSAGLSRAADELAQHTREAVAKLQKK